MERKLLISEGTKIATVVPFGLFRQSQQQNAVFPRVPKLQRATPVLDSSGEGLRVKLPPPLDEKGEQYLPYP
jgi:hypothetical protein